MNTSPTLHRAFFRTRVDGPALTQTFWPCEKGSRWTRASFTIVDIFKTLTVSQMEDGQWLLSVDGEPRTVVSSFTNSTDDVDTNLGAGSWIISHFHDVTVGGKFYLGHGLLVKNPPVNIPFSSNQIMTIELPGLGGPTKTVRIKNALIGNEYYATSDASSNQCNGYNSSNSPTVIGTRNGVQYRYLGFMQLKGNTVENPEPDGLEDYWGGNSVFCSNPAMDFLNSKFEDMVIIDARPSAMISPFNLLSILKHCS